LPAAKDRSAPANKVFSLDRRRGGHERHDDIGGSTRRAPALSVEQAAGL
jgi:hypothetical protein